MERWAYSYTPHRAVDDLTVRGPDGPTNILGFYALASAFVLIEDLPPELTKRYPRQIPVTRLGCLATRADLHGQGLRRLLLADVAHTAAQAVSSAGIVVDAKNDDAVRFCQRLRFPSLRRPVA